MRVEAAPGSPKRAFWNTSAEWRPEQNRITHVNEDHQAANQTHFDEDIRIFKLSRRA